MTVDTGGEDLLSLLTQLASTRRPTPRADRSCTVLTRWARLRPRRSSFQTTSTSSFRSARKAAVESGPVVVDLIDRNWADILRVAATMAAGTLRPSQILRKLAAYPRQNELAAALREVGRVERSLFMIDWTTDPGMRRRVQVGLNKGEAHHALKRAINFHQRGELRDRTGEGQHYRVAGLNLLAAIIIYWNTLKLGEAVFAGRKAGLAIPAEFLAHVSPLGWEHINLTGEYRWLRTGSTGSAKPLT